MFDQGFFAIRIIDSNSAIIGRSLVKNSKSLSLLIGHKLTGHGALLLDITLSAKLIRVDVVLLRLILLTNWHNGHSTRIVSDLHPQSKEIRTATIASNY